jgi:hypothetical protein
LERTDIFKSPDDRGIVLSALSVLFNFVFESRRDVALRLFKLRETICNRKIENERPKGITPKSALEFPVFMEVGVLKQLVNYITKNRGDSSLTYGIELYTLQSLEGLISELPRLPLEMQSERFKRAVQLGRILCQNACRVSWSEPPASRRSLPDLSELITTCVKNLFDFVFETYGEENILKFLRKCSLIVEDGERIDAIHEVVVWMKRYATGKNGNNFQCVIKHIACGQRQDRKLWKTLRTELMNAIHGNSHSAGRWVHITRLFAPKTNFDWLSGISAAIVGQLEENKGGALSTALEAMIEVTHDCINDVNWAVRLWLPRVHSASAHDSQFFCEELVKCYDNAVDVIERVCKVDFSAFHPRNFLSAMKMACDFMQGVVTLLQSLIRMEDIGNIELENLARRVTCSLDGKLSSLWIRYPKNGDPTVVPKLMALIEKTRFEVRQLINKEQFDGWRNDFCRLKDLCVTLDAESEESVDTKRHERSDGWSDMDDD